MRLLIFVTDAFGGHGGIAQYNRDLITALAADASVQDITVLPRTVSYAPSALPEKVTFVQAAAGDKKKFVREALRHALPTTAPRPDLILCGHINLLPLAALVASLRRVPLVLMVHGIDVWQPPASPLVERLTRLALRKVTAVWSVSALTRDKMQLWSGLSSSLFTVLPNTIDLSRYQPAPKSTDLIDRYGLAGKTVVMMLGRLAASEAYKGADEMLQVMPTLRALRPDLVFMIAGDGDDRPRLEEKARTLGVADAVVFTGFVREDEKMDHLRLADAFVMPGRGEGFGIVYLEALACGIPAVGSQVDGSREALREGLLGALVNPDEPQEIIDATLYQLSAPRRVPPGLEYFAVPAFTARAQAALRRSLAPFRSAPPAV